MPRPTAAQLAYGSCTVILSTFAMLLLSRASTGLGIAVIAVSALTLGLLVAMTAPLPKAHTAPAEAESAEAESAEAESAETESAEATPREEPVTTAL
ncbi:hypothetical protein LK07_12365 [Streptomyces pluripotens]|uniref:Uncharacterized protein n=1 Tax=Streptomyces pluripotens TaxID=1355015 RepID=A0A221NXM5_9ACTN|nr:hypothetical protein [Streptomyces pluripotens]ARP70443.1 hypothetical protein LK06_011240 [Streptomyces pluripotens]ASN24700.1 hypothetical protein LK07_12365 [Streptomyces pluripotens]